jgi:transposase-like protein
MVYLVINGKKTPTEVCRENPVSKSALYRWLQDFTLRGEVAFQRLGQYQRKPNVLTMAMLGGGAETIETCIAEDHSHDSPETRIADLERLCGRLVLENFLLKQALAEGQQSAPEAER